MALTVGDMQRGGMKGSRAWASLDKGMGMGSDVDNDNSEERHVTHALPASHQGGKEALGVPKLLTSSKPFVADVSVTDGPTSRESSITEHLRPPTKESDRWRLNGSEGLGSVATIDPVAVDHVDARLLATPKPILTSSPPNYYLDSAGGTPPMQRKEDPFVKDDPWSRRNKAKDAKESGAKYFQIGHLSDECEIAEGDEDLTKVFEEENRRLEEKRKAREALARVKEQESQSEAEEEVDEAKTVDQFEIHTPEQKKSGQRKALKTAKRLKSMIIKCKRPVKMSTGSQTPMRNAESTVRCEVGIQTDISLPHTVPAIWHCHAPGAESVVDMPREAVISALQEEHLDVDTGGYNDDDENTTIPLGTEVGDTGTTAGSEMTTIATGGGTSVPDEDDATSQASFTELMSIWDIEDKEELSPTKYQGDVEDTIADGGVQEAVNKLERRISLQRLRKIPTPPGLGTEGADLPIDTVQHCRTDVTKPQAQAKKVVKRMRMARGMTIDSGAADNVMPRRMVRGKDNRIRPSPGSRAGVHYVAACNTRIRNEGECDFHFTTKNGIPENYVFQIANVNKPLCAVSYLVDHGHQVIFDRDASTGVDTSRIVCKKTGKTIQLKRERNVWTIDVYIEEDTDQNEVQDFGRLG